MSTKQESGACAPDSIRQSAIRHDKKKAPPVRRGARYRVRSGQDAGCDGKTLDRSVSKLRQLRFVRS